MLTANVEKILVEQIEKEGYSSNLYLAMASWAEVEGYEGVSKWFYAQSEEERVHMLKLIYYVNDRGGKAIVPAFQKPQIKWSNVKEAFTESLKHEEFISKSINDIVAVCLAEKDFTTHQWIQWFVTEQIEEESNVNHLLAKLNLLGDGNLYNFDKDIMRLRSDSDAAEAGE